MLRREPRTRDILRELLRRNYRPPFSADEIEECAIAVMSPSELIEAGAGAASAAAMAVFSSVSWDAVDAVLDRYCRAGCKHYHKLRDGEGDGCLACGCAGKKLRTKIKSGYFPCPVDLFTPVTISAIAREVDHGQQA